MKESGNMSAIENLRRNIEYAMFNFHRRILGEECGEGRTIYELTEAELQDQAEAYLDRPLTADELEKVSEIIINDIIASISEAISSVDK